MEDRELFRSIRMTLLPFRFVEVGLENSPLKAIPFPAFPLYTIEPVGKRRAAAIGETRMSNLGSISAARIVQKSAWLIYLEISLFEVARADD